jgi:hypothetical protein
MKLSLNDHQRRMAMHQITFGNSLSPEVAECLRRASLACADNKKTETGIVEFFCALYLQDPTELAVHFHGDFDSVLKNVIPVHRFGREGLFPQGMLDGIASEGDSSETGFGYTFHFSNELLRLLWLGTQIANAVGKKTSLLDVIAAVTLDRGWMDELLRNGLTPSHKIADFEREIGPVLFYATIHTAEGWPRHAEFDYEGTVPPPFTLEFSTPAGLFPPIRSGRVMLNNSQVAEIVWPGKPSVSAKVELLKSNRVEFEIEGSNFGSAQLTIKGTLA